MNRAPSFVKPNERTARTNDGGTNDGRANDWK
jgi:hypothetical protein